VKLLSYKPLKPADPQNSNPRKKKKKTRRKPDGIYRAAFATRADENFGNENNAGWREAGINCRSANERAAGISRDETRESSSPPAGRPAGKRRTTAVRRRLGVRAAVAISPPHARQLIKATIEPSSI